MKSNLIDLEAEKPTRGKQRINKLTAAYIAGIIDGEGYLGIQKKNGYYRPVIKIAMTNQEIIQWFANSFGGLINTRIRDKENAKDCYQVEFIGNRKVFPILRSIYPYLRVKKKQAEKIFQFEKTLTNQFDIKYIKLGYGTGKVKVLKNTIKEIRENLYLDIKALNFRGRVQPERLNNLTTFNG